MGGTDTVTDENEYDFIEPIKSRQRRTGRVLDQQFTMGEAIAPAKNGNSNKGHNDKKSSSHT